MVTVRPATTDVCANASPTGGTVSSHVAMRLVKQAADKILKRLTPLRKDLDDTADSREFNTILQISLKMQGIFFICDDVSKCVRRFIVYCLSCGLETHCCCSGKK